MAAVLSLGCAPAGAVEPLAVARVADGVFVHLGTQQQPTAANEGAIANVGFIVGARCVAVIDSGGSRAEGERLLAAVRHVSALPVCYVVNTHVHPDHVFGNAAFESEHPQFVGHARLPAALAARGEHYRRALERDLGAAAEGSTVVAPTLTVEDRRVLDLGGRELELRAWPAAHTEDDLTVFDRASGTLWLSDLLFVGRIPVVDGSLKGWLEACARIAEMSPARVVPGHGDMGNWRDALAAQTRYLKALLDGTRVAIRSHRTLAQAVEEVGWSERGHWLLFDDYHRRNVAAAYAELEWEE
ncbi:MAG TPA: quinoprotein relay system zinc metallohydrolase 2 [Burkholderiaceae bacterium]